MTPLTRTVGARVRRARHGQGLTLTEVAAKAGVTLTAARNIEVGQESRYPNLVAVADALGLSLDKLTSQPECVTCDGFPPARFTCLECGKTGGTR